MLICPRLFSTIARAVLKAQYTSPIKIYSTKSLKTLKLLEKEHKTKPFDIIAVNSFCGRRVISHQTSASRVLPHTFSFLSKRRRRCFSQERKNLELETGILISSMDCNSEILACSTLKTCDFFKKSVIQLHPWAGKVIGFLSIPY